MIRGFRWIVLSLLYSSLVVPFPKLPIRVAAQDTVPSECEPRPGRRVSQLVFKVRVGRIFFNQLCADLCREGGVRERVFHIHGGSQKAKLNVVDHFVWSLCLPGILCAYVGIYLKDIFVKILLKSVGKTLTKRSSPAEASLAGCTEDTSHEDLRWVVGTQ